MGRKRTEKEIGTRLRELLIQQEDLQERLAALTGHLGAEVGALNGTYPDETPAEAELDLEQVLDLLGQLAIAPTEADAVEIIVTAARHLLPGTRGALSLRGEDEGLAVAGVWDSEEQWNRPYQNAEQSASPPARLTQQVTSGPTGEAVTFAVRGFGMRVGELRVWPEDMTAVSPEKAALESRGELLARSAGLVLAGMSLQRRLRHHTVRDPLTGLFNRRYLRDTLVREVHRARRNDTAVGLIVLDIDRFGQFNDRYGHHEGDRMLQALSGLLQGSFRGSDVCCRYSGERFALLLPEADLEGTGLRAEEIRAAIAQTRIQRDGNDLDGITVSVGYAATPVHADNADDLIAAADSAIYLARQDGGNSARCAERFE
ncbi:MAG: GGDEF domain-containing protein [Ectothiorhodospiraceae bacterium]|jgi:diguanylate cyclase (GGDEF)-like protein